MVVVFVLIAAVIITYNGGSDNYGLSIHCYFGSMCGPMLDPRYGPMGSYLREIIIIGNYWGTEPFRCPIVYFSLIAPSMHPTCAEGAAIYKCVCACICLKFIYNNRSPAVVLLALVISPRSPFCSMRYG